MHNFDVVIIGAGLAGLHCAKMLSLAGASVLLVDRKPDLTSGIHTTGIFVRKTFEDFDFPAGTLGKPVSRVTLYSPKLKALDLKSGKAEFRVGKMGALYNAYLKECIDSGVEFANGTRYISARTAVGESIITLEKTGRRFEVKAKVLVGADGTNSRVARDLYLDENKEWIVGYEKVLRNIPLKDEPTLHCFLDAKLAPGYLAWVTNDGDEVHIGVGGYADKFDPRRALAEFEEKVASKYVDLSKAETAETRGGRIPVGGVLRQIANTNGLLIGDAAGAVSPLTAGGLDPCLRLSAIAANLMIERLAADDPQILLQYSGKLFRSRFISRLWMRRVISVFTSQTLLEIGCGFLRTKAGSAIAKHIFFGRGSFPDADIMMSAGKKAVVTAKQKAL